MGNLTLPGTHRRLGQSCGYGRGRDIPLRYVHGEPYRGPSSIIVKIDAGNFEYLQKAYSTE